MWLITQEAQDVYKIFQTTASLTAYELVPLCI